MTELETLSLPALVRVYNEVTGETVGRFSDRAKGVRRVAAALNQRGLEVAVADGAPKVQPVRSRFADLPAVEHKGGPGLARLRASREAETLRETVLADQERAIPAPVAAVVEPPAAPVAPAAPAQKAGRAPKHGAGDRVLEVVPNPKKKGSRSFLAFSQYVAGETVGAFFASCAAVGIDEKEARSNLAWDVRKGFVKVGAAAVRPGDAAAAYAEETGVDYGRALVACNMD